MSLSTYISGTYVQLVTQLGWTTQINTIIAKTLQLYGVDLEAEAVDEEKLEKIADFCVWRQALNDISLDYAFSQDGVGSFNRNQAVEQVRLNMNAAYTSAMPYLSEYQIVVHPDDSNNDWWASDSESDL